MASLFISYSRKDIDAARRLTEALKGQKLDFWIDWEGIPPTVDWWREIETGIEEADIFLFLLSPDSCKSKVCRQEIEHAIKNGKRLIPVLVRELNGDEGPSELGHLNWIFLRDGDDFDLAFGKLLNAIHTDYAWVQTHRELQVKALDWEKSGRENSFLLFGKELQEAEHQLATNTSKEPHPTDLQREYVHLSRQAVDRRRTRNAGIATITAIALAVLAVFGFLQAGLAATNEKEAVRQAATAQAASTLAISNEATAIANANQARQQTSFALAALALSEKEENLDLSLLLSIAAFDAEQNPTTRSTVLTLGDTNPNLAAYLSVEDPFWTTMAFSPDHKLLVSANEATFSLWDASNPAVPYRLLTSAVNETPISGPAIGSNNTLLALGSLDSAITLWDIRDPGHPNQIGTLPDSGIIFGFTKNGSLLISKDSSGKLSIWDVQKPNSPRKISTIQDSVDTLLIRGDLLISRNMDSRIAIWDIADPAHPGQLGVLPNPVGLYDVSADGDLLVEENADEVIFWNISDPAAPGQIGALSGLKDISDVRLSNNRLAVASCAEWTTVGANIDPWVQQSPESTSCVKSLITLWDITDPSHATQQLTLTGQNESILQLLFEPGGSRLLSKGENRIILWDLPNPTSRFELSRVSTEDGSGITSLAFSPDHKWLAVGSNRIILWNVEDPYKPTQSITLDTSTQWVNGLAFSQDGSVIVASDNYKLSGWEVQTGKAIPLQCELSEGTIITTIALGHYNNADILAIGDAQGRISFCALSSSRTLRLPASLAGPENWISSLAFVAEDGTLLVSGNENGALILWDLGTGQVIDPPLREAGNFSITGIASGPDRRLLSARTMDNMMILWDMRDPAKPELLSSRAAGEDFINQDRERLAMNANHMIATGGLGDQIVIWDASDPVDPFLLATFAGKTGDSNNNNSDEVAFSPNGKILASGYSDGTVILWDLDPSSWIEKTCRRAGRNFTRSEWERYFSNKPYSKTCQQWPLEPQATPTPSPMPQT